MYMYIETERYGRARVSTYMHACMYICHKEAAAAWAAKMGAAFLEAPGSVWDQSMTVSQSSQVWAKEGFRLHMLCTCRLIPYSFLLGTFFELIESYNHKAVYPQRRV